MSSKFARRFVIALLAGFALSACGDSEPTQRKAFGDFLQTRIIDKPGLHVPKPSDDELKSFGPYAKDYGIVTGFNQAMSDKVSGPMQAAMQKGVFRSIDELLTRRSDLTAAADGFKTLRTALDEELAKAEAAHAALNEPADLKPIFDKAYERTVSGPAKAFEDIFPAVDSALKAAGDLADFLDKHRDTVKVNGGMVQASDPKLVAEINRLIQALNGNSQAVTEAQRKLQTLIQGS